jgi:hypothetical protein
MHIRPNHYIDENVSFLFLAMRCLKTKYLTARLREAGVYEQILNALHLCVSSVKKID